ncbi:MAG: hypothetical protein LBJ61_04425 [Deltaproteobacteria bacterium]|nr:hypothetical protein [Deltaproteobacteria bacterium]
MSQNKQLGYFLGLALALAVWLACPAVPAAAQQTNGGGNFQFNELDFDRQGTGQAPATRDPDAGLTDLFSGEPVQAPSQTVKTPAQPPAIPAADGRLQSLPGVPSPVSVPAGQGEAKIEVANGKAAPAARPVRRRRAARKKDPEFRNPQERRFYYAMQAWRNHPELAPVNCKSYVPDRPLYHVRCFGALALR